MLQIITIILILILIIVLYNYFTAPVFRPRKSDPDILPFVSILIPARNEEKNIARCLKALVAQDYQNLEIIIGNDHSTDNTDTIVLEYTRKFSFIKMINLPELPDGWRGKNFGAHNLSVTAGGSIFLFLDADVVLNTGAVSSAVKYLNDYNTDVLSVFPGQLTISWGEKLIVPLLNFFLLTLLPLLQVYESKRISFSAGIGQFMMFRRTAYELLGGHKKLRNEIVEDVEFIKLAKKNGLKVLAMLDEGLVACRMYDGIRDAVNGFTKNFFRGTRLPVPVFLIFLAVYFGIFFIPFLLVFLKIYYIVPVIIILSIRWMISEKSGQPVINIILHPVQMLFFLYIGIRSFSVGGRIKWKGRAV